MSCIRTRIRMPQKVCVPLWLGVEVLADEAIIRVAHSLNWYRFIGRILGKALYNGILVDVAFAGFFLAKVCLSVSLMSAELID